MPVQVWVGEKPEHPNERRAIMALAQGLERLDGLYLILANFSVTGNNIDLVIIKHDAVFIVELKHCDGRVFGGVNGPWFVESANGERKRLNPGRKNPYNQVIAYFYALTNFLNERRRDFLSAQKTNSVDFRTCKRVVVIGPRIQEGSKIELDWKVELRGLDELPIFLVTERSSEIELTDEEMEAIPQLLGCTRWTEINNLLAGVLPNLDDVDEQLAPTPAAPVAAPAVETTTSPTAAPAPTPHVPVAPPAPVNPLQRLLQRLRLTTGRLALLTSTLVLVLLLVVLWRPGQPTSRPPEGVPIAAITPGAASVSLPAGSPAEAGCTWSGAQPVGKRWNMQTQEWVNVGLNDTTSTALAEVIVT
ncbi:MAG: NERD domain-containing protein, partial [Chloroflexaceae bacterium]|nr:NERD domain-containing protein [Chloroflexaceae bacterium]